MATMHASASAFGLRVTLSLWSAIDGPIRVGRDHQQSATTGYSNSPDAPLGVTDPKLTADKAECRARSDEIPNADVGSSWTSTSGLGSHQVSQFMSLSSVT